MNADNIDTEVELLKLKRDLASAKVDATRLKSQNESLIKQLELADKRAAFADSIARDEINAEILSRIKFSGKGTAVLCLSDFHAEETVDPATVNGLNEFNLDIAAKRGKSVARRTVELLDSVKALAKIEDAVIWLGGDMINGYLAPEMEEDNNLSPTEATLFVEDLLWTMIKTIRKQASLKKVVVVTSYGNHGRTGPKKRIATGYANSYEWMMYRQMENQSRRSNDGLLWKVENGYHNWLDIQGRACRFHHGDAINYWGGVGGITIPVNKAIAQWNKVRTANYDFFGHFHQSVHMNRWICNGSLVGFNAFALAIKAEYEEPSQTLAIITKERGLIAALPVFCN